MKICVEQYGTKIDIDGNLADLIRKKELQLLLTIENNEDTERHQFILNREQALYLSKRLIDSVNDPILAENGFRVV